MHKPTKNAYNPGLVFRVLQYLNSDINIYHTVTIILKFWVVLEQTFCKNGTKLSLIWNQCYNLVYLRWLDKNSDLSPPTFTKMVSRLETMPLYSKTNSAVLVWLLKKWKILGETTEVYLSATTVMLLLNRNNKDLHCQEVTLLNEGPVEHTKLHYKIWIL